MKYFCLLRKSTRTDQNTRHTAPDFLWYTTICNVILMECVKLLLKFLYSEKSGKAAKECCKMKNWRKSPRSFSLDVCTATDRSLFQKKPNLCDLHSWHSRAEWGRTPMSRTTPCRPFRLDNCIILYRTMRVFDLDSGALGIVCLMWNRCSYPWSRKDPKCNCYSSLYPSGPATL